MIGRSGSSAFSWVAASQSLRIGKWRCCGAALDDCMLFPPGAEGFAKSATVGRRTPRFLRGVPSGSEMLLVPGAEGPELLGVRLVGALARVPAPVTGEDGFHLATELCLAVFGVEFLDAARHTGFDAGHRTAVGHDAQLFFFEQELAILAVAA